MTTTENLNQQVPPTDTENADPQQGENTDVRVECGGGGCVQNPPPSVRQQPESVR